MIKYLARERKTETVAVLVIIIAVLLFCLNVIFFAPKLPPYTSSYDEIKSKIRNGDLIFLCGNTFSEKMVRVITGSCWSHIGIAVQEPGNKGVLNIFECDMGQYQKNGARVMNLNRKLSSYKGEKIGAWMSMSSPDGAFSYDNIKSIIDDTLSKGVEMQTRFLNWVMCDTILYNKLCEDNKTFCSALVAQTYNQLGAIPNKEKFHQYSPASFYNHKIPLSKGFSYSTPIIFNF